MSINLNLRSELNRALTWNELDSNFKSLATEVDKYIGSVGNGYAIFSNGLIVQWGSGETATGFEEVVNFNITFPTRCFGVWIEEIYADGWLTGNSGIYVSPTIYSYKMYDNGKFYLTGSMQKIGFNYYQASPNIGYTWIALGK